MENFKIPTGSKIKMKTSELGDVTLYWDQSDEGIGRHLVVLFLMTLVGGVSFFMVAGTFLWIANHSDVFTDVLALPIFMLVIRIIVGCFVLYMLFLMFRPQKPEKITFHSDYLEYDTGTASLTSYMYNSSYSSSQRDKVFRRRKVFQRLPRFEIKFGREQNPSRMYFDFESKRYEVGYGLTEPDVDWLYSLLGAWAK